MKSKEFVCLVCDHVTTNQICLNCGACLLKLGAESCRECLIHNGIIDEKGNKLDRKKTCNRCGRIFEFELPQDWSKVQNRRLCNNCDKRVNRKQKWMEKKKTEVTQ